MTIPVLKPAPLNEDQGLKAAIDHHETIATFAGSTCDHGEEGKRPCSHCMKLVRHITDLWAERLAHRAQFIRSELDVQSINVVVRLDLAYLIALGQLNPEMAQQLGGFGPL